ncbi:MAG TPA: biopolymer transporter TolR [Chitinophagaceae bacterium]
MSHLLHKVFSLLSFGALLHLSAGAQKVGVFEGHTDIGGVLHPGSSMYNPKERAYLLSGSGANIWGEADEFHFAWRRLKGDFILQARVRFTDTGHDPHRKAGWMVRSTLEGTSPSVNATVHGDGLASLQFREGAGAEMKEMKMETMAPDIIQLERRGGRYIMSAARQGEPYAVQEVDSMALGDDVYVGLFICAHHKEAVEEAHFDNVRIIVPAKQGFVPYRDYIGSHIETLDVASGRRRIVYSNPASLQAPNWTPDGKSLLYNSNGLMYKLDLKRRKVSQLNTGVVKNNNNDHVLSFDGRMLGLSSSSPDGKYGSVVYTVPVKGGVPKQVTPIGLSYLHGWSPDGKYLIYTGERNGEFDIYKIGADWGEELRLTNSPGLDDGSEYSPDGKYIFFNSTRSGTMQIWRMNANGSEPVQVTNDGYNNWFPHVSPDGKWIVFLSFLKDVKPDDHPFYRHVYLRMMPVEGGVPKVVVYLYGGQGSINTPSWSPDSKQFAFVSNSALLLE